MSERGGTVFLVDDDDAVRDSVSLLMRSAGLRTREFASAAEFLEQYGRDQLGCLLLDVRMPGMSGLELQKELNRRNHTLPIVFISAHGDIPMAVERLTAREREVMSQLVQGKANKVIASDLGVSQRTVEIHRARVMEKMQASSLAQLVRMVLIAEAEL